MAHMPNPAHHLFYVYAGARNDFLHVLNVFLKKIQRRIIFMTHENDMAFTIQCP